MKNKLFKYTDRWGKNTYYIVAMSADSAATKWNELHPNEKLNACAFKLVSKNVII